MVFDDVPHFGMENPCILEPEIHPSLWSRRELSRVMDASSSSCAWRKRIVPQELVLTNDTNEAKEIGMLSPKFSKTLGHFEQVSHIFGGVPGVSCHDLVSLQSSSIFFDGILTKTKHFGDPNDYGNPWGLHHWAGFHQQELWFQHKKYGFDHNSLCSNQQK